MNSQTDCKQDVGTATLMKPFYLDVKSCLIAPENCAVSTVGQRRKSANTLDVYIRWVIIFNLALFSLPNNFGKSLDLGCILSFTLGSGQFKGF